MNDAPPSFSLWSGGLLAVAEQWLRIRRGNRRDRLRRSFFYLGVGWLGLMVLSLVERLWLGRWDPLLADFAVHARWLVSVPLLILAEETTAARMTASTVYLVDAGVVPGPWQERFSEILQRTARLSGSKAIEGGLLVMALGSRIPWLLSGGERLAALWHSLISLSFFRFLLGRWLWRWALWGRVVWQVSRLPLRLIGSHPDRAGGVGVLELPSRAFGVFVLGASTVVAASWGTVISRTGVAPKSLFEELLGFVLLVLLLALAPLFPLVGPLGRNRLRAYYDFGLLARRHDEHFDEKWIRSSSDDPLGSPDMSSLVDLGTVAEKVVGLPLLPFPRQLMIEIIVLALLPMIPLYLANVPLEELAGRLLGGLAGAGGVE